MGDGPDPDAGLQRGFDLLGRAPGGERLEKFNDLWKAWDHGTKAFGDGDPKAIVDLAGDAGKGLGKAFGHAPGVLKGVGGLMENAGRKSGLQSLEKFGQQVFSKGGSEVVGELAAAGTPIIDAALNALTVMSLALGFGDPDSGDRFGNGSVQFQKVYEMLESAFPDGDWEGTGSQAYAKRNTKQQSRVELMADADNTIHGIIQKEAGQLKFTSDVIDAASDVLMICIPIAIGLYAIPIVGPEMSMTFQIAAVAGALPLPYAQMVRMAAEAMQNALQVQQAIGKYNEVASTAHPCGAASAVNPPPGGSSGFPIPPGTGGLPGTSGTSGDGTDINLARSTNASGVGSSSSGPADSKAEPVGTLGAPPAPGAPNSPAASGVPGTTTVPSTPSTPSTPTAPSASAVSGAAGTVGAPSMPGTPAAPSAPKAPGGGGTPAATAAFDALSARKSPSLDPWDDDDEPLYVEPSGPYGAGPGPTVGGSHSAPVVHESEGETEPSQGRST